MQLEVSIKPEYYFYQPAHDAALSMNVVVIENGWDTPQTDIEACEFSENIWNEIRNQLPKELWETLIVCEA